MPTYKLIISYDGTRYAGWQTQQSRKPQALSQKPKTIQEEIEAALQKLFKKKVKIEGSGRTDAGVHALAQTAHFKLDKPFDPLKLQSALNAYLPCDIFCVRAEEEAPDFHARFCAKKKTYRYVIINTSNRPIFVSSYGYWVRFPLDVSLMKREARCLVGEHNFKSFQASEKFKRSSVTTIHAIRIRKCKLLDSFPFMKGLNLVLIDIEGKGFLRGMVRNIVGTLCDVGRGRLAAGSVKTILEKKDRKAAGFCAPAQGLYLCEVDYA